MSSENIERGIERITVSERQDDLIRFANGTTFSWSEIPDIYPAQDDGSNRYNPYIFYSSADPGTSSYVNYRADPGTSSYVNYMEQLSRLNAQMVQWGSNARDAADAISSLSTLVGMNGTEVILDEFADEPTPLEGDDSLDVAELLFGEEADVDKSPGI